MNKKKGWDKCRKLTCSMYENNEKKNEPRRMLFSSFSSSVNENMNKANN